MDFMETASDVEEYIFRSELLLGESLSFSPHIGKSKDNVTRDPDKVTTKTTTYGVDIGYTPPERPSITLGLQTEDRKKEGKEVFSPADSTDQTISFNLDNTQGTLPYTLELNLQDSLDHTNYSIDTSEIGTVLTLPLEIGTIADGQLSQEYIYKKERETSRRLSRTNKTTFSWETLAADKILLTGSYSFEDLFCFEYNEKTQTQTASLLAETELTDNLLITSGYESQVVQGVGPSRSNTLSFTLDYAPWEVLTLNGGYEVGWEIIDDDTTTTYVYSFSSEYAPTLSFSASLEGSMEKGEDEIGQSLSLSLEGKPYSYYPGRELLSRIYSGDKDA